jgi:hypothetical protein
VVAAGLPFTPVAHALEHEVTELLHSSPVLAGGLMFAHFAVSVLVIRFLFVSVLSTQRFRRRFPVKPTVPETKRKDVTAGK